MTYDETVALREKLFKKEISTEMAKELYFASIKETEKAWHTKDWKERRNATIKDKCEQCGSTKNLTLQHFSHPPKYQEIEKLVFQKFYKKDCGEISKNINDNDIAEYIKSHPNKDGIEIVNMPEIVASKVRNKYLNDIERITMLNYLDFNIDYLSFKDTKTFCKVCAFNWDKNKMNICPKCKKNYKSFRFETCKSCYTDNLPDGEKKEQLKAQMKEKEQQEKKRQQDKIEYKKWKSNPDNARECEKDENGEICCMEYLCGDCLGNHKFCMFKYFNRPDRA
jgi:predicted Zn-ribbon and HTH transcriptional regulator